MNAITLFVVMLSTGPNYNSDCRFQPKETTTIGRTNPGVKELTALLCDRYKVEIASFTAWRVP